MALTGLPPTTYHTTERSFSFENEWWEKYLVQKILWLWLPIIIFVLLALGCGNPIGI